MGSPSALIGTHPDADSFIRHKELPALVQGAQFGADSHTCPFWMRNGARATVTAQSSGVVCKGKAPKAPCVWSVSGQHGDDGPRRGDQSTTAKSPKALKTPDVWTGEDRPPVSRADRRHLVVANRPSKLRQSPFWMPIRGPASVLIHSRRMKRPPEICRAAHRAQKWIDLKKQPAPVSTDCTNRAPGANQKCGSIKGTKALRRTHPPAASCAAFGSLVM